MSAARVDQKCLKKFKKCKKIKKIWKYYKKFCKNFQIFTLSNFIYFPLRPFPLNKYVHLYHTVTRTSREIISNMPFLTYPQESFLSSFVRPCQTFTLDSYSFTAINQYVSIAQSCIIFSCMSRTASQNDASPEFIVLDGVIFYTFFHSPLTTFSFTSIHAPKMSHGNCISIK